MTTAMNLEAEYDDGEFIPLTDTREWSSFWMENEESLLAEVGDERTCFELAMNCSLFVGGGGGPLFRVGFVDAE
jgi:hypothetical protein